MKLRLRYGQSILSFVFVFIVLAALAVGMTRIWAWFTINYGARQARYQQSRITASLPDSYSSETDYLTHPPVGGYQPIDLTDEWIFSARPTETVDYDLPDFRGLEDADAECREECPECVECFTDPDNPEEEICNVIPDCLCYMECMCKQQLRPQVAMYDAQISSLEDSAAQMRDEAEELEDKAEECDDPWELCWWGGFGAPAKKLRSSARKLRAEADKLCCGWGSCTDCVEGSQAYAVKAIRDATLACCDAEGLGVEDPAEYDHARDLCLDEILVNQCSTLRDGRISGWDDDIEYIDREIDFANKIRNKILSRLYNKDKGCPAWAYYRCKYASCDPQENNIIPLCDQQCQHDCDVRCHDKCVADCAGDADPPSCEASCIAAICQDSFPHDTWWRDCYDTCMRDGDYGECLKNKLKTCTANCMDSSQYSDYLEECCNSFSCVQYDNGGGDCGFAVFDGGQTHGYQKPYRCLHPPCWWTWQYLKFFNPPEPKQKYKQVWKYFIHSKPAGGQLHPYDFFPYDPNDLVTDWHTYSLPFNLNDTSWQNRSCFVETELCDSDGACYYEDGTINPDCLTDPGDPTSMKSCGLERLADDQVSYINDVLMVEKAKYECKKTAVADCCEALWTEIPSEDPDEPPDTSCCFEEYSFEEGTCTDEGSYCESGLKHSECQIRCMEIAANVGEEESQGLLDICPECAGLEDDPSEMEACINECLSSLGEEENCCANHCSISSGKDYRDCLDKCIQALPDGPCGE